MRIAYVLTGGLHPSGQVEVIPVWITLLSRLAERHDVHAFTVRHLTTPQSYTLNGFQVHDLGSPGRGGLFGRLAQYRALMRALRRHGPFDLIHGVWANPNGLLAAAAGRRLGIPSVVTCDSGEFAALPAIDYGLQHTSAGRALSRLVCATATEIHVSTRYMEQLAMLNGWHPKRLPIGIDVSRFARVLAPSTAPPWRLLKVGSLSRVKNQRRLLDALALVRREVDVELDLVGEDTLGGELQAHARTLGIADCVRFHGFVPQDSLRPFFERAHVYVQSSLHDAAPIAVLEAAAASLPIVGTNVGYVADWAPHAAFAVPVDDAEALARGITAMLRNPARDAMAAKAHELVTTHDVGWTANALEALYGGLMSPGLKPGPAR